MTKSEVSLRKIKRRCPESSWICSQEQRWTISYLVMPSTFSSSHCRQVIKMQSRAVILLSRKKLSAKTLIIFLVKFYKCKRRCLVIWVTANLLQHAFLDCWLMLSKRGSKWNQEKCRIEYGFRHLSNVSRILILWVFRAWSILMIPVIQYFYEDNTWPFMLKVFKYFLESEATQGSYKVAAEMTQLSMSDSKGIHKAKIMYTCPDMWLRP